jgi:hypothetical protein
MQENQTLRNLLRSLASFIGDGAGGILPKLGWEMSDFNNFINRSETDTAWEGYQRRKKAAANAEAMSSGQKRSADDGPSNLSKKQRTGDAGDPSYSMLLPMNNGTNPVTGEGMFPPGRPEAAGLFPDMMRTSNGSPMFIPPSSSTVPTQYAGQPSGSGGPGYPSTYIPGDHMNIESPLPSLSFASPSGGSSSRTTDQASPALEDDEDPNKNEAYKLIQSVISTYYFIDTHVWNLPAIIWITSSVTVHIVYQLL